MKEGRKEGGEGGEWEGRVKKGFDRRFRMVPSSTWKLPFPHYELSYNTEPS